MSTDTDWGAVADAAHRDWVDSERDEKLETLEAEVIRLRAEVEAYRKDAERWQHARKLLTVDDISERQTTLEAWNNLVIEFECERADRAIDAAMGASE